MSGLSDIENRSAVAVRHLVLIFALGCIIESSPDWHTYEKRHLEVEVIGVRLRSLLLTRSTPPPHDRQVLLPNWVRVQHVSKKHLHADWTSLRTIPYSIM
jgi:hypothetical protein